MGVRSTMSPASMGTSVRPMSPSSNFTTYSLPRAVAAAGLEQESDYITPADIPMQGIQLSTKPKGGAGGGRGPMGAFRQLLNCSTHCFHHQQQLSIDLDGEDSPILVVLHNENPVADGSAGEGRNVSYTGEDSRLRTQMQVSPDVRLSPLVFVALEYLGSLLRIVSADLSHGHHDFLANSKLSN